MNAISLGNPVGVPVGGIPAVIIERSMPVLTATRVVTPWRRKFGFDLEFGTLRYRLRCIPENVDLALSWRVDMPGILGAPRALHDLDEALAEPLDAMLQSAMVAALPASLGKKVTDSSEFTVWGLTEAICGDDEGIIEPDEGDLPLPRMSPCLLAVAVRRLIRTKVFTAPAELREACCWVERRVRNLRCDLAMCSETACSIWAVLRKHAPEHTPDWCDDEPIPFD
jgi:hypothetical protein